MSADGIAFGAGSLALGDDSEGKARPSAVSDLFRCLVAGARSGAPARGSSEALRRFLCPSDDEPVERTEQPVLSPQPRRDHEREAAFNQVRRFRISAR